MKKISALFIALFLCISITTKAQNNIGYQSFVVEYYEPSEDMLVYAQMLIESGIIDEAVANLNASFILPKPININFASMPNQGPHQIGDQINMPYEFLHQNHMILSATNYFETHEEALVTILNLTEFVLYHEIGHAIVHVLDIPVLGKHEDAVDGFAAILSTIWNLDEVALSAADMMDATSMLEEGNEYQPSEFWDSHSLNEQRMYSIFCLIYGSNPEKHAGLLQSLGMPEEKGQSCQYDYQETLRNWTKVLEGNIRQ
jgi:hypothetical protein